MWPMMKRSLEIFLFTYPTVFSTNPWSLHRWTFRNNFSAQSHGNWGIFTGITCPKCEHHVWVWSQVLLSWHQYTGIYVLLMPYDAHSGKIFALPGKKTDSVCLSSFQLWSSSCITSVHCSLQGCSTLRFSTI